MRTTFVEVFIALCMVGLVAIAGFVVYDAVTSTTRRVCVESHEAYRWVLISTGKSAIPVRQKHTVCDAYITECWVDESWGSCPPEAP